MITITGKNLQTTIKKQKLI